MTENYQLISRPARKSDPAFLGKKEIYAPSVIILKFLQAPVRESEL